jgi:hypothetical protein
MMGQQKPLTDEQKQRVKQFLDSKGIAMRCPVCQSAEQIEDFLGCAVSAEMFSMGDLHGARTDMSSFYAYAMLLCDNCGHTRFFNAVTVGLVSPPPGWAGSTGT